jgi:hypothetical protein
MSATRRMGAIDEDIHDRFIKELFVFCCDECLALDQIQQSNMNAMKELY